MVFLNRKRKLKSKILVKLMLAPQEVDVVKHKINLMINETLKICCDELILQNATISSERKSILNRIVDYIESEQLASRPVQLVYICTHNSRRSHFGQIWAALAASYFKIDGVHTFSGGTEATAFHPNAIKALRSIGFEIEPMDESSNPKYKVQFGDGLFSDCFSKVYDDAVNPKSNFAAIMTCSDAEENCPFIPGVSVRVATTYDDPKSFDGTDLQDQKYLERCKQIGLECLYVFHEVSRRLQQNTTNQF